MAKILVWEDGQKVVRDALPGELPAAPPPTAADVDAEADRRILAGATFTVPGYAAPIRLAGDDKTRERLGQADREAAKQIAAGNGAATLCWRDADNVVHTLSWEQVAALHSAAFDYISAVIQAGWPLKDSASIPADYADDSRWP